MPSRKFWGENRQGLWVLILLLFIVVVAFVTSLSHAATHSLPVEWRTDSVTTIVYGHLGDMAVVETLKTEPPPIVDSVAAGIGVIDLMDFMDRIGVDSISLDSLFEWLPRDSVLYDTARSYNIKPYYKDWLEEQHTEESK